MKHEQEKWGYLKLQLIHFSPTRQLLSCNDFEQNDPQLIDIVPFPLLCTTNKVWTFLGNATESNSALPFIFLFGKETGLPLGAILELWSIERALRGRLQFQPGCYMIRKCLICARYGNC